ncbi:ABC transporter substrate-binding protein [Aurantimicrobium minutum]|uniref:ABC transporter substrate-binding protein n=1 Tax=Aurantimicrobium minutum TaxID=708131 RepID=UPI0024756317|nr:ABC transporter substrate-binding protein [Aurantimicrobium minutum]
MGFNKIATVFVAGAVVLGMAACSGGSAVTPTVTPTAVKPSGDGILRIGDMTPVSGDLAAYSAAQAAGVDLAAAEVNEQGGYNKVPVEVLHRNAGDGDAAATEASFNDLVSRGVDVIIAPASATVVATLEELVAKNDSNVAIVSIANKKTAPKGATVAAITPDETLSKRLKASDPSLSELGYGAEAYDLAIASILAATVSKDDGGASITQGLIAVTLQNGFPCTSYGMCVSAVGDKQSINYTGPAGQINYDPTTGVAYFGKTIDVAKK